MRTLLSRPSRALAALFLGLAAAAGPRAQTRLELGKMWTFENPPLGYLKEEYGFAPTQEWLDALRLASLRFGSWCSASFVSPKGLIMTNHHCVRDNVAQASPPDEDWVENGYYASSQEEEVPLAGLTVSQLVAMHDVTEKMLAGIEASDNDRVAEDKRAANEESVLEEAHERHPGLRPEVVTLHNGVVFQLYLYKVYDDIRLVCAPHLQSAHFGGDPDNFTYPRYSIDFAFCRAYEDGQPADTSAHYFRWSKTGALEGDLVFVTGNPGDTGRLLTVAQMEYLRDAEYPIVLEMLENRMAILRVFAEMDPGRSRQLRGIILGDENSVKAIRGYLGGLLDPALMAHKARLEAEFQSAVQRDPELREKYGAVWDALRDIGARRTSLEPKRFFQEPSYSGHLAVASAIVRAVDPEQDESERATARRLALAMPVRSNQLVDALFINHLLRAQRWLGADDPYIRAVIGDLDAVSAAKRIAESRVTDRAFVEELLAGGHEAVSASDDPAVAAARVLVPLMDANQELHEELQAREAVQGRMVGQALFAVYGDKISPDATMTLRFSDGVVAGYPYNGTVAPYRTTFFGLYGRNVEFSNEDPFHLPDAWLQRKDVIDMTKAVNFVTTNDIIGGNSGSPVVDVDLRVVGLIFDGNIEQLPNRFLFRDRVERSISVHVDAIMEAMRKIYGADRVVKELVDTAGN